jgi:hypothetical protein
MIYIDCGWCRLVSGFDSDLGISLTSDGFSIPSEVKSN